MTNNTTIDEARQHRYDLHPTIQQAINRFEQSAGLSVTNIDDSPSVVRNIDGIPEYDLAIITELE